MAELVVVYVGLWLFSMAWTAVDGEARTISYVIWHLAKRKSWPSEPGFLWGTWWRLITMAALQVGMLATLFGFTWNAWADAWSPPSAIGIGLGGLFMMSFQHPSLHPYFEWRRRRIAAKVCHQLDPIALQLEELKMVNSLTQAAEYQTEDGWLARHPLGDTYWTPDAVPVAYILPERRSVIFPIDFEYFVAWKLPSNLAQRGNQLPFEGPYSSTFKVRNAAKLRGCPNWTLLRTDMDDGGVLDRMLCQTEA